MSAKDKCDSLFKKHLRQCLEYRARPDRILRATQLGLENFLSESTRPGAFLEPSGRDFKHS